jgi:hypothetical protein
MSGNHDGERLETGEHNGRLRVGQAVALQFHALTGLTGVVEGLRDGHRCLVRMDTVQRGVLLVVDARAVRCAKELSQ